MQFSSDGEMRDVVLFRIHPQRRQGSERNASGVLRTGCFCLATCKADGCQAAGQDYLKSISKRWKALPERAPLCRE